jgi:hypothetical protein
MLGKDVQLPDDRHLAPQVDVAHPDEVVTVHSDQDRRVPQAAQGRFLRPPGREAVRDVVVTGEGVGVGSGVLPDPPDRLGVGDCRLADVRGVRVTSGRFGSSSL